MDIGKDDLEQRKSLLGITLTEFGLDARRQRARETFITPWERRETFSRPMTDKPFDV